MCRHCNSKPLHISYSRVTELCLRVDVRKFEIAYPKLTCVDMFRERFVNTKDMKYFFLTQYWKLIYWFRADLLVGVYHNFSLQERTFEYASILQLLRSFFFKAFQYFVNVCNISQSSVSHTPALHSCSQSTAVHLYGDIKFPHQKKHSYRESFKGHYTYILYSCFLFLFYCTLFDSCQVFPDTHF